ncbi:GumC family protein [Qipengyuania seohaensis]|uniref:GumC family protein n=1 Tax=Qipengyuania seohaensis TaxID=266951 RepID=UPI0018E25730|nr:polysaccharide biosynthesis tyrosine autokinase [Qipengyuania seohaensis]
MATHIHAGSEPATTQSREGHNDFRKAPFLPDPGDLWAILRRRIWIFLAIAGTILILAIAYALLQPKIYSATASVLIEPGQPAVVDLQPVSPDLVPDTNVIDTEVEILSSPRLAGKVAESLDIGRYAEFGGGERSPVNDNTRPGTHPLASAVQRHVTIRRSGLTYLIGINARSRNPELAAAIANEYALQYLEQQKSGKLEVSQDAGEFLQGRLVDLRAKAANADAALHNYKIRNGLMSAEGATMAEQEVSVLNQEISAARADLAEKQGLLSAARSRVGRGGGGAQVPAALQSSTVAELRSREARLSGELANLEERYGGRHPQVLRAREEIADTRQQIQSQIDRILASLESDVVAARSRLGSLEASQSGARGSLEANDAAQVGFLELERSAEAARSIYEAFLKRAQEMGSQEGLIRADASIETLARVPRSPSSPNIPLIIALGATMALVGGLLGVAAGEYFDARIRTRSDVEDKLRIPYLGAVPELGSTTESAVRGVAPHDFLVEHPQSKFAESLRALGSALKLGTPDGARSLAITSALPREGKSTTSLCLARSLALSGKRTILVDCDSRRRAASEMLLPEKHVGLRGFLAGSLSLTDAVFVEDATGLSVLGSRVPKDDGSDLFASSRFSELLAQLEDNYKVVIVDTAPILGIAETRTLVRDVDATLVIARWRSTSIKAVDTAVDLLLTSEARVAGLALTQVDVRQHASTGQQDIYSYQEEFAGYYME